MSKIMEGISPLPWGYDPEIESLYSNIEGGDDFAMVDGLSHADAAYIIHACKLYPELVEALERLENLTAKDAAIVSAILAKCKAGAE
jgi:hypothetical protein